MLNKAQLEDEIRIYRKSWQNLKNEIAEKTARGEQDCTLGALEYAAQIQVGLLEYLLKEYYQPREYLKCQHCTSRVLVTPDLDKKSWMCPRRHLNISR